MSVSQLEIDRAVDIARRYGAKKVILFGSAVHKPDEAHDIDLAIGGVPGWEFFGMAAEIEREMGYPVDIIPLEPENWFTEKISRQGLILYERS